MDKRKFLTGCACCMSLMAFTACTKRFEMGSRDLFPNEESINHIEIHLVEHCNLNCKYCSHFSCIAEKEFYNVEKYERDMAQLAKVTGSRIVNFEILGGEPLLHPEIETILDITRKYLPKTEIEVFTNGLLLNSKQDSFWEAMKRNNIFLSPSIYPIDINWEPIFKKAKKYKVKVMHDPSQREITFKDVEKCVIDEFYKLNLKLKGTEKWRKYQCRFASNCANYIDGKIYPCFLISNIRHFNKKFGKKLPVTPKDYIDIYKVTSIEEIKKFLYNMPVPFCKYCGRVTQMKKWETAPNHSIYEWMEPENA